MAAQSKITLLLELKDKLGMGLDKAKKMVKGSVGEMQNSLSKFKQSNMQAFDALKQGVPGLDGALGMIANPYVLATAAVVGLGAGLVKATTMANDWHQQMAKINVTAGLSQKELGGLSDKLLEIGGRNIAPLEEVPQAFNRIISAGLSVNQSLATLEPTLRAAKAGFTDIETVASAGVAVMQSSGKSATQVYDVLFATVNKGNAEFKDIAQYLPKVIPLARNVGFALDETAGAYASLTTKLSAEQSTTALQGIMRSLSNKDIVNNFKGIGVSIYDTKGKVKPILDIIDQLGNKMSGLTDKQRMLKFGKLGLDQESTLGFSTLLQDLPGLKTAIDATVNSQGALNKAYEDAKSPMDEWKEVQNKLKVQMIKVGELILPYLSKVGGLVSDIIDGLTGTQTATNGWMDSLMPIINVLKSIWQITQMPIKAVIGIIQAIGEWAMKSELVKDVAWAIGQVFEGVYGVIAWISDKISWLWDHTLGPILNKIEDAYTGIKSILGFDTTKRETVNPVDARAISDSQINVAAKAMGLNADTIKKNKALLIQKGDEYWGRTDEKQKDKPGEGDLGSAAGVGSVTGSAKQIKNLTINIDSFVKGGISSQNPEINKMSASELEKWFVEMMMRVVNNVETSYS